MPTSTGAGEVPKCSSSTDEMVLRMRAADIVEDAEFAVEAVNADIRSNQRNYRSVFQFDLKTPIQYLNMASHFEAASETTPDNNERETLRQLARTHLMLATVLQRPAKLLRFKSNCESRSAGQR